MTGESASLSSFGDALVAAGFGVSFRQPEDEPPVLNVWSPASPRVGVSVIVGVPGADGIPWLRAALIADLAPCADVPAAVGALSSVFVAWGLPLPLAH
ncbi:hypothetical protein GCM10022221_79290 [Actinocorallia aurea]